MTPADYSILTGAIEATGATRRAVMPKLVATVDALTTLFWTEHQAFILTPFVKYAAAMRCLRKSRAYSLSIWAPGSRGF
jgi:hypothetical protein